jgi:hypothetical protein
MALIVLLRSFTSSLSEERGEGDSLEFWEGGRDISFSGSSNGWFMFVVVMVNAGKF